MKNKTEIYEDAENNFRWRVIARNGKIISESSEGYKTRRACRRGLEITFTTIGYFIVNPKRKGVVQISAWKRLQDEKPKDQQDCIIRKSGHYWVGTWFEDTQTFSGGVQSDLWMPIPLAPGDEG